MATSIENKEINDNIDKKEPTINLEDNIDKTES